jgi:hypothetical protein
MANNILPDQASEQAKNRQRDRDKTDQKTKREVKKAIANVDDPDVQAALESMLRLVTGESDQRGTGNGNGQ